MLRDRLAEVEALLSKVVGQPQVETASVMVDPAIDATTSELPDGNMSITTGVECNPHSPPAIQLPHHAHEPASADHLSSSLAPPRQEFTPILPALSAWGSIDHTMDMDASVGESPGIISGHNIPHSWEPAPAIPRPEPRSCDGDKGTIEKNVSPH